MAMAGWSEQHRGGAQQDRTRPADDPEVIEPVVARPQQADPQDGTDALAMGNRRAGDGAGDDPEEVAGGDVDSTACPVPVIRLRDAARARRSARGGPTPTLPVPPPWASRSVVEDGGVTHELVSHMHPLVLARIHGNGILATAVTDVSVSVVDRPRGHGWSRQSPRIQVEGGSYPLAEAHLLLQAITALIEQIRGPGPNART